MECDGGGALTVSAAVPDCPPARGMMFVLPRATAEAVVETSCVGLTVAMAGLLESHMNETF